MGIKKIKFQLNLFFVLFTLLIVMGSWLFYQNFGQFDARIYEISKKNIQALDSLTLIEEAVRSQNIFLAIDELKSLEKFNSQHFPNWLDSQDFKNLFYQVWQDAESYLKNKDGAQAMGEQQVVFSKLDQLASAYAKLFWNFSRDERFWLNTRSRHYLVFWTVAVGVLMFFGLFFFAKIYRRVRDQEHQENLFSILGTRDFTTGFFDRSVFDILAVQEMDRAKRQGHGIGILLLQIESYKQIVMDFGNLASDRLLYQFAEIIKSVRRCYDGIFKYGENGFAVIFPEVNKEKMVKIVNRLHDVFSGKDFMVTHDQVKIIPRIKVGFSVYPDDGADLQTLVRVAVAEKLGDDDSVVVGERNDAAGFPDMVFVGAETLIKADELVPETLPERAQEISLDSVESIIDKYAEHSETVMGSDLFTGDYTIAQNEPSQKPQKTEQKLADLPDVVLALTQDEEVLQQLAKESGEKKMAEQEKINKELLAARAKSSQIDQVTEQLLKKITRHYNLESNQIGFSNISEIKVVKGDEQDEVIMVDFDKKKTDVAEKFRRRLRLQKEQ